MGLRETTHGFLLFGAFLFLIFAVYGVIQARREKDRTFYLDATIVFLLSLLGFLVFLEQSPLLVLLLLAFTCLLSLVAWPITWPKRIRQLDRMYATIIATTIHKVDFSAPLRMRDFLTMKGRLKMASKWGIQKAVLLTWLFDTIFAGGIFSISTLLGITSIISAITYTIVASSFPTIIFYRQIKKFLLSGSK